MFYKFFSSILFILFFIIFVSNCGKQDNFSTLLIKSTYLRLDSQVDTKLKITKVSPGYWTATYGDFVIKYVNKSLPWGVKVYFYFGFREKLFNYNNNVVQNIIKNWQNTQIIEAKAVAPYTWDVYINERLYGRGDSVMKIGLQFIYKIVLPNNQIIYDKGSISHWGYYEMPIEEYISSTCSDPDNEGYCKGKVNIIDKWE